MPADAALMLIALLVLGRAEPDRLLAGARTCLGDVYDSGYYSGGPPPRGRGACTEVLYYAFLNVGLDLQDRVDRDIRSHPGLYPNRRDRNIDYRWCPNLIVWFRRHASELPKDRDFRAGDVVFWSMLNDGVADHCGLVSDRTGPRGKPLVVHNVGPYCAEDASLGRWTVVGHFRK
ncbi:MAG: DUF1287 domain-containing protein [Candidatus Eremiobacterota bacterium]